MRAATGDSIIYRILVCAWLCVCTCLCVCVGFNSKQPQKPMFSEYKCLNKCRTAKSHLLGLPCDRSPTPRVCLSDSHTLFRQSSSPSFPSLPLAVSRVTHCLQAFHSALLSLLLTLLFPFRAPACSIMWPASTLRFLHKISAGPTASDCMTWKSATSPQRRYHRS